MEDFFLDIVYKDKKVRFRIMNPQAPLSTLMNNLRHAIGKDGRLIFDFPSIDATGAPLDYFFGKNRHKAQRKAKFYINKCRSASCMQSGWKRTSA